VARRTTHPYARTERVGRLVHEVVAETLERLVDRDERLELVTVTHVAMSGDLRSATVLIASGDEGTFEALEEVRPELQSAIARQVRMKRVPILRFEIDAQLAAYRELDAVLRRVHGDALGDGRHLPRR
jgi:ribosome-binding factor A